MKTVIACTFRYLLAIVLGCMLSFSATAQELPGTAAFKRLDKNGDGNITRDEAPSAESFRAADANQNGSVSPDEFRRFLTNRNRPVPEGAAPTRTVGESGSRNSGCADSSSASSRSIRSYSMSARLGSSRM